MRKTKIVGTIGPKSMEYSVLKKLVEAGLNVVRINLSHAKLTDMEIILNNVKRIRKELKVPLPIMLDTRGPELRVGTFKDGKVTLKANQQFVLTSRLVEGDEKQVSINMKSIVKSVKAGDMVLACDGLITLKVLEVKGSDIITKVKTGGVISNKKSLSVPGVEFKTPYLNELDQKDILWGIRNGADLLAISFVNCKKDVEDVREFIEKSNGNLKIISKIESKKGVDNMQEIIEASDGVMVARGDLGVEVAMEKLPDIQKRMITMANECGKVVITATEMLESMIRNKRPTRAEVSDVANAVYDGTSCVMLSGETANGDNPVEAVKTMSEIVLETEKHICYHHQNLNKVSSVSDVISHAIVSATEIENVKGIVVFTSSGESAEHISRFRPQVDIVGATPNEQVYRQLELVWGVKPVLTKIFKSTDEMFNIAKDLAKQNKLAKKGESVVVSCGEPKRRKTDLMKVLEI